MSSESFAAFRRNVGPELAELAEQHFQNDLQQSDRDALRSAAGSLGFHTKIGSLLGLSLGIFMALRLRRGRAEAFRHFRTAEQPVALKFASGREQALPDMRPFLRPSPLGTVATTFFFGAGGLFLGGETGLLTGSVAAKNAVSADPAARARIEAAFRAFRRDVLRKELDQIDSGRGSAWDKGFDWFKK